MSFDAGGREVSMATPQQQQQQREQIARQQLAEIGFEAVPVGGPPQPFVPGPPNLAMSGGLTGGTTQEAQELPHFRKK
jgi:hypothetical protein